MISISSFCSEPDLTLEEKFSESSLVVVGTITSMKLGEIKKYNTDSSETQHIEISFEINEQIYGKSDKEIIINAYSVDWVKNDTSQMCTAGFSSDQIEVGNNYIAYLKKADGKYFISGNSNQYLDNTFDSKKVMKESTHDGKLDPNTAWLKKYRMAEIKKLRQLASKSIETGIHHHEPTRMFNEIILQNGMLKGLPEKYMPATFDLKKMILTIGKNKIDLSECIDDFFPYDLYGSLDDDLFEDGSGSKNKPTDQSCKLSIIASWNEGLAINPNTLFMEVYPKDDTHYFGLQFDLDSAEPTKFTIFTTKTEDGFILRKSYELKIGPYKRILPIKRK